MHSGLPATTEAEVARQGRVGVVFGIAAYVWWGLCPIYFKAVSHVAPLEILCHRVVWSAVLLMAVVVILRKMPVAIESLRRKRTALTLAGTSVLISINWLIFIYAVATDQLLQASLGYFINPLVSVLLGMIFLGERLRFWQKVSVILAACGVFYWIVQNGHVPYLGLVLAFSFGCYGLLRKTAAVGSLVGLTAETVFLTPISLAYVLFLASTGEASFGSNWPITVLLGAAGVVTAMPLLWFASAARRLRLSTLGFLQYIAPTGQFLLAVIAFGEPFTIAHMITFTVIWTALGIYSVDAAAAGRQKRGEGTPPA